MADIELVIKIDEGKLWLLKNEPIKENFNIYELASYIDKGVAIPKRHGRLIDADALTEKAPEIQEYLDVLAQTIIEAYNSESEEENETT